MNIRVIQIGALTPVENLTLVREQLLAAHRYRNTLVSIERGRRHAVRALHETPEVREAIEAVATATKETRKKAKQALAKAV